MMGSLGFYKGSFKGLLKGSTRALQVLMLQVVRGSTGVPLRVLQAFVVFFLKGFL